MDQTVEVKPEVEKEPEARPIPVGIQRINALSRLGLLVVYFEWRTEIELPETFTQARIDAFKEEVKELYSKISLKETRTGRRILILE